MPSSFSTDLKIELMVTGENAGTWGDNTNDNLAVVEQAIAGFESISIAGGAQTTTLAIANSPDIVNSKARNVVIKLTGVITGNQIVTIPTGINKTYIVENGTTGAFTVEFKQAGGTGTTFSATDKAIKILFADGTNINPVDLNTLSGDVATAQIENLAVTSAKLASFAVTSARLDTNAVTAVKILQSTITQAKLAANSVGSSQLISTGVVAGSYTTTSLTVDADGRITAAANGASAGGGGFVLTSAVTGPASGTFTADASTTSIQYFLRAGGGGGSGARRAPNNGPFCGGNRGVPGKFGGFGIFQTSITAPYSVPFAIGAGGAGGAGGYNGASGGSSGGNSTFNTNFTASGGGAGSGFGGPTTVVFQSPYVSSTDLVQSLDSTANVILNQNPLSYAVNDKTGLTNASQALNTGFIATVSNFAANNNPNITPTGDTTATSQGGASNSGNVPGPNGNPGYNGLLLVFENIGE